MEQLKTYEGGYVVLPLEAYEKLKEAARKAETTVNTEAPISEVVKEALKKEQEATPPEETDKGKKKDASKSKRPQVNHGKVNALHKAGWSPAKIADEMGISVTAVYKHIDKE